MRAASLNPVGLIIGILLFTGSVGEGSDFCDCALTADNAVLLVSCFFFGEP